MIRHQTLFMETTRIEPPQTVGEIQKILGQYGASAIRTDYEAGEVIAVSFTIKINSDQIPFRLPCRWEAIKMIFESRRSRRSHRGRPSGDLTIQAKRVAWRQILRWVEAQLAPTETQAATETSPATSTTQKVFKRLQSTSFFPPFSDTSP